METMESSKNGTVLIEVYETKDGIASSLSQITVAADGHWRVNGLQNKTVSQGILSDKTLTLLKTKIAQWNALAQPLANGWAEPKFGGCTAPIQMKALRIGNTALHDASGPRRSIGERMDGLLGKTERRRTLIHEIYAELGGIIDAN